MDKQNGTSHKFNVCTYDIHRASFPKHLKSGKHLQNEIIIPSNFFTESKK